MGVVFIYFYFLCIISLQILEPDIVFESFIPKTMNDEISAYPNLNSEKKIFVFFVCENIVSESSFTGETRPKFGERLFTLILPQGLTKDY